MELCSDNRWSRDDISSADFSDEALTHETGGNELYSVVVHSLQQLLATVVDEANASEINQKRRTVERNLLPALIKLVNASARELSFDDESRRRRFVLTSNSYNFISHTRTRRAIRLPQFFVLG